MIHRVHSKSLSKSESPSLGIRTLDFDPDFDSDPDSPNGIEQSRKFTEKRHEKGAECVFHAYVYPKLKGLEPFDGGNKETLCPPCDFTGVWKGWHPNGQLATIRSYVNGEEDGEHIFWDENGKKIMEEVFDNGMRHGIWKTWNVDGSIKNQCEYRNGKPWNGDCQLFHLKTWMAKYENGKPMYGHVPADGERGSDDWKYFINGEEVTHEKYCKFHDLDGTDYSIIGTSIYKGREYLTSKRLGSD